jgi:hypothetical protein
MNDLQTTRKTLALERDKTLKAIRQIDPKHRLLVFEMSQLDEVDTQMRYDLMRVLYLPRVPLEIPLTPGQEVEAYENMVDDLKAALSLALFLKSLP